MLSYSDRFMKVMSESMMSSNAFGGGNNAGQTAGSFGNVDSYASGDARVPSALGTVDLTKHPRKKKKKINRKKHNNDVKPMVQTRNSVDSGMQGPSNKMNHGFM